MSSMIRRGEKMALLDEINDGDQVVVNFNNAKLTLCHGTVIHIPVATGDSWIIREDDGTLHYISEGCTITKRGEE